MTAPERLSEKQAREYIPATREKLKRLRAKRSIKFYRIGHKTIVYDRGSIDKYLASVAVAGRS